MATTLRQFNQALDFLVRDVRAATAPLTRLSGVLPPLAARPARNPALIYLADAADRANAVGAHGAPGAPAFGSLADLRRHFSGSRSRRGIEHLSVDVLRALQRLTGTAAEPWRPARQGHVAGPSFRLLEASVRRLARILGGAGARGGPRALAGGRDQGAPPGFTLPGANQFLSQLRASCALPRAINAASPSKLQSQVRRADDHGAESPIAGGLGGLHATIDHLAPLRALGHVPARKATSIGTGGLFGNEPISSRLPRAPRFSLTDYFRRRLVTTPLADGRVLPQSQFARYVRRLSAVARKLAEFAAGPTGAIARRMAALPAMPRAIVLQPRWPRLPAAAPDSHEARAQRARLLDSMGRLAPAPAAHATPAAPSTINVSINVHGVANGDEFVRRHGYEIARTLEQVIERRARRAF